jgi:hypothetical protein
MERYEIKIEWDGPFSVEEVIDKMIDGGEKPDWDGNDYGLYQIYGRHILCGKNTLLYIGMTTEQTFSQRFKEHKVWLDEDQDNEDIKIYIGKIYDPKKHSKKDSWRLWKRDVQIAEKVLIYKYSPNYNGREISSKPKLHFNSVRLVHVGERNRLEEEDNIPRDFSEW